MAFLLENPSFSMDVSDQVDVHQSEPGVLQSSGTTSAPSSGESTPRSCQCCHGRMSSFSLDCQTFCIKCRGSDCGFDKCDECMSWTSEEMEAYGEIAQIARQ